MLECVTSGYVFFLSVSHHTCLCDREQTGRENLKVELALYKLYELDHLSNLSTKYSKELLSCQQKAAIALQSVICWSFDAVQ